MKRTWSKVKTLKYPGLPVTATISRVALRDLKKYHNVNQKNTLNMVDEMVGQAIIQDSVSLRK